MKPKQAIQKEIDRSNKHAAKVNAGNERFKAMKEGTYVPAKYRAATPASVDLQSAFKHLENIGSKLGMQSSIDHLNNFPI